MGEGALKFALALIATILLPRQCHAETVLRVGSTETIVFPILNYAASRDPLNGVQILVDKPSFVTVLTGTSNLGPANILPGTSEEFTVDIQIVGPATAGPFNVALTASFGDPTNALLGIGQPLPVSATAHFVLEASSPTSETNSGNGSLLGPVVPSTNCVVVSATDTISGIAEITITGPSGFSRTGSFKCPHYAKMMGQDLCNLPAGSYTHVVKNCVGLSTPTYFDIQTAQHYFGLCLEGNNFAERCSTKTASAGDLLAGEWDLTVAKIFVDQWSPCAPQDYSCLYAAVYVAGTTPVPGSGAEFTRTTKIPVDYGYGVVNTTNSQVAFAVNNTVSVQGSGSLTSGVTNAEYTVAQGEGFVGRVISSQVGRGMPKCSEGIGGCTSPPGGAAKTDASNCSPWDHMTIRRGALRWRTGNCLDVSGSEIVFTSTVPINFTFTDTIGIDTTSLAIYQFDGVDWSSSTVENQTVFKVSTTSVITASGTYTRSGSFAVFFQGQDSSAPMTTFQLTGTSSTFANTLFVATDTFIVLTATDPVVNGFSTQVSTIWYRVDATADSPEFTAYSSSISLLPGPHIFEYRAQDTFGNLEPIRASTFVITAGDVFKTSHDYRALGKLLVGSYASGAQAGIQAWGDADSTLLVSSPSKTTMLAVGSYGNTGVGRTWSDPFLDINYSTRTQDIPLQLRSGNTTDSDPSAQIAFGYDGEPSMRHLLRSRHGSAASSNRLDWLLWYPGTGSTTTIPSLGVLSLQARSGTTGSVHVMPSGTPDVELEVSNGATTGGGTIHVTGSGTHSSRDLKTDIRYLTDKERAAGAQDTLALRHARFRYKKLLPSKELVADPTQPLRRGLIYEESPRSVQGPGEAVLVNERILNLELAIQQAAEKLTRLQKRLEELKP